uniref:Retrotransposon gag domain-containing protein n=1 Tax=Globodera rostochiensis TaxID=31243 RepID=A0A914GZG9_GLORO
MPLTSYPTGSGISLACGPETANVNERDGELSGISLAVKDGEVTIGANARKFWHGKAPVNVPEVEKGRPKKNEPTIYGINMISSGFSTISSLEMFGEESASAFDDWADRFKDHLTVSGKNFTDQEKVTRLKLCLKDAPRALFKELSPAQTTTLDLAMTALRAKLESPQRREIAKRTLTLCRQREDESVAQFLRRLTLLVKATNHSLTETQRKEKVCEEFLDRLKPSMSFLIRLIGLTQAKSLEIVKAQAEELEALLLANRGEEWNACPSPGDAGNEQGSSGSNMRNFGQFSAPNEQRQPPSFGGARGGFRNWGQGRQEQFSHNNWSGDRQCQRNGPELEKKNKKEGVGVMKKKLSDAQSLSAGRGHGMPKALVKSEDVHRVYGTGGPGKLHRQTWRAEQVRMAATITVLNLWGTVRFPHFI